MLRYFILLTICLSIFCSHVHAQKAVEEDSDSVVGVQFDLGVPDGVALGFALSPSVYWLKMVPAVTTNGFGLGWRMGFVFDPIDYGIGPSLSIEYGGYFPFSISSVVGEDSPDIQYSYCNLHAGVELGDPNSFRFFLHAGPTWLFVSTRELFNTIQKNVEESDFGLVQMSDINASLLLMPTVKLGFRLMFL